MSLYLFQLGHQPLLSVAEIKTVLANMGTTITNEALGQQFLQITTKSPLDISQLNHTLGGTVKIMEALPDVVAQPASLADYLISTSPDGKLNFSLSGPAASTKRLAIATKKN